MRTWMTEGGPLAPSPEQVDRRFPLYIVSDGLFCSQLVCFLPPEGRGRRGR